MATNDIFIKITKRIFKGNRGKQFQLLRDKENIRIYLESGSTPTPDEQTWIDEVNEEWEFYDSQIRKFLGETKLGEHK